MPEEYKQLVPFEVNYICDVCLDGYLRGAELIPSTKDLPSQVWVHTCSNCSHQKNIIGTQYPTIKYRYPTTIPMEF